MSRPTEPLSLRWLLTVHVVLVTRFGGATGVRDVGAIESALRRPLTSYGGEQQFITPFERAAALWVGLIRNHGFIDGNKRTGTAAMSRWLLAEGYRLRSGQSDLVEAAVSIATNKMDETGAATWLESHSAPVV